MTNHKSDKKHIEHVFPLAEQIKDPSLKDKVIEAWLMGLDDSKWDRIESAVFDPKIDASECSLVQHTNFVASAALQIGQFAHDIFHLPVNFDVLIAGALLHDVSKLNEYDRKQNTDIGNKIAHGTYGVHIALNLGLPLDVIHIISCHTPLNNLLPTSLEGVIVVYADYCAAELIFLTKGARLMLLAHKPEPGFGFRVKQREG